MSAAEPDPRSGPAARALAVEAAALLLPTACLGWLLLFLLANLHRGLDLTDESSYLLVTLQPAAFPMPTQFGHYTGLLLRAVDGSLYGLRVVGVVLLLAATAAFAAGLEAALAPIRRHAPSRLARGARLATLLTGSLCYYASWLTTPSYNLLNLCGLLLACGALLGASAAAAGPGAAGGERAARRRVHRGALVLGAAGAICFLAKPTTAAALAPAALACVLATPLRRAALRFLALAGVAALLLLGAHALAFQDGVAGFAEELSVAAELGGALALGHTAESALGRGHHGLGSLLARGARGLPLAWWAAVLALGIAMARLSRAGRRQWSDGLAAVGLAAAGIGLGLGDAWAGGERRAHLLGPAGVSLVLATAVVSALAQLASRSSARGSEVPRDPPARALAPFARACGTAFALALVPALYSIGTNNPLPRHVWGAFVFYPAACLALLAPLDAGRRRGSLAELALCTLVALGAVSALGGAARDPYRLPQPLAAQTRLVELGGGATRAFVDPRTERWIQALRAPAVAAGLRPGTPLLDWTGATPGAALVLGATPPATPWLLGKAPGIREFTRRVLALAPPETLARAWLLTSPGGRRALPESLLRELDLPFPEGYTVVGRARTGFRSERQILWQPRAQAGGATSSRKARIRSK